MKSIMLTLLAALMLVACSKRGMDDDPSSAFRIAEVTGDANFDSRVQKYNMLTTDERYQLWRDHLVKARNQFTNEGQPAKVTLVNELLAGISHATFEDGTTRDVLVNYTMPEWTQRARSVLSDQEIYDITFDPTVSVIGRVAPTIISDDGAGCFCHVGISGFSCRKVTVGFPSGITITNGICEQGSVTCNNSSVGCGWFWLQSCNGNHCNF